MVERATIKIGKLDAARRQLETAVRLYFSEADAVSIHTLVSAAYQVLSDVNKAHGGEPMLKEQIPTWVSPDATAESKRLLNEAANFFKHADRDHDEVLEFAEGPTGLLLYDAVRKYRELTGENVPVLAVYDVWFWLGPGSHLVADAERGRTLADLRESFPHATHASFFAEALPVVTKRIGKAQNGCGQPFVGFTWIECRTGHAFDLSSMWIV